MPLQNLNIPCQYVLFCPATSRSHAEHATVVMLSTFLLEIQTEGGEGEWRYDQLVCCKYNAQEPSTQYKPEKLVCHLSRL